MVMAADKGKRSIIGRGSSIIPFGLFGTLLYLLPRVAAGDVFRIQLDWIPSLGITLSLAIDGLSLLFALIICGIGFFVSLYAADYLPEKAETGKFYVYLHGFLLAMLGLVVADNLLALFVFWELTTLISYLLIGFECELETARLNARQALLITGAGGLALLVGFLLLGNIANTYELSQISLLSDIIRADPLYLAVLVMVFAGSFTKSAQFPFHFWLPNAMTAPTPISAFLHSATMVKAGIYLLARLHPILGGTLAWMGTLVVTGSITALLGSVLAMQATDLKRILAFTTIMALGILTMFLGGQTTPALTAAMTFLMVHSLYKCSLFLVVGIIDHQTGTRMIDRLGGLLKPMPITAFAAAAAALSMAGFPLFFGFIGKEIMYKGALTEDMFPVFATTAALLANSLMVAVAGLLIIKPFWGAARKTPLIPCEAPLDHVVRSGFPGRPRPDLRNCARLDRSLADRAGSQGLSPVHGRYSAEIISRNQRTLIVKCSHLQPGNRILPAQPTVAAGHRSHPSENTDPIRVHLYRGPQQHCKNCQNPNPPASKRILASLSECHHRFGGFRRRSAVSC